MRRGKMTRDEAKIVLDIMKTADSECWDCAGKLFNRFIKQYPQYMDLAKDIYQNKFNVDWEISE